MSFAITILLVILGIFIHESGHIVAIKITKAGKIQKVGFIPKILFKRLPAVGVFWTPCIEQKNFRIKRKIIAAGGIISNLLIGIFLWSSLEIVNLPNIVGDKISELIFINIFFAFCLALPIPINGYDGWKFWKI
jgi:hypothetical protein